jgi:hypothetical protein
MPWHPFYDERSFMSASSRPLRFAAALSLAAVTLAACSGMNGGPMPASGGSLRLSGTEEVPPVSGTGSGAGSIAVATDGAVSGKITTTGVNGTAAHIHNGASGKNGPVVLPLVRSGEGEWSVPPGAKLTPEQLKAYQAGELYVNVHTDANKGGEVRAQLKP